MVNIQAESIGGALLIEKSSLEPAQMVGRGRAGGAEEGLWLISSPTIFFFCHACNLQYHLVFLFSLGS